MDLQNLHRFSVIRRGTDFFLIKTSDLKPDEESHIFSGSHNDARKLWHRLIKNSHDTRLKDTNMASDLESDLKLAREEWEVNLTVIAEHRKDEWTMLVMLKDTAEAYHCHRYFIMGDKWMVSVDGRGVSLKKAVKWAFGNEEYEE